MNKKSLKKPLNPQINWVYIINVFYINIDTIINPEVKDLTELKHLFKTNFRKFKEIIYESEFYMYHDKPVLKKVFY